MDNSINKNIPKYVFDKEYSTQWKREVDFLEERGIAYSYAKRNAKYPVTKYKYTKTPDLFLALAEFFNQVRNEKFFESVEKISKEVEKLPIEDGYISVKESDLTEAEKKLITSEDVEKILKDE